MNFFRKVGVVSALVMALTTTAWANSAYTVVDANYLNGKAGTIVSSDGRVNPSVLPGTGTLPGAPAVHAFTDANGQQRVLAYNYKYGGGVKPEAVIYNPTTTPWTPVQTIADLGGDNITNLYSVTTVGNFLYGIDYETAKIVKIDMTNNSYSVQSVMYAFPGTTPGFEKHGVAITTVGADIYGLFTEVDNAWAKNPNYLPSKVVKLNKDLMPVGTIAPVGKNAFTLKHFNNKLYVASIGGKQNQNAYNSGQSKLDVVDLANNNMSVAPNPLTAGTAIPYDFRDITFSSTGDAYILAGKYNANWNMDGAVYKTTATGIAAGQIGGIIEPLNDVPGYCWALHFESAADRLWFAKGNRIDLHQGSDYGRLFGAQQPMQAGTVLSDSNYPNLNSMTLIGQGVTLQGYQDPARVAGHSNMKSMRKVKNTK